jgi:hypothetical protein
MRDDMKWFKKVNMRFMENSVEKPYMALEL